MSKVYISNCNSYDVDQIKTAISESMIKMINN